MQAKKKNSSHSTEQSMTTGNALTLDNCHKNVAIERATSVSSGK